MRRTVTVLSLLFFVLFFVLPATSIAAGPSHKPLGPVKVRISPIDPSVTASEIKPGDVIQFKVTALSSIDVQKLKIEVELLEGAKLVSGDTSWTGPASKNEEKSIVLTVQAPENGNGVIRAKAIIPPPNTTRFSAETEYVLGPQKEEKTDKNEHPRKKDSKGRDVIEYR